MEKISERLTNLNKISKNILKYGLLIVLIALIISNILLRRADSIENLTIARAFVCSNVEALCEVLLGAIMFDVLMIKK